jgi:hypothetical protein
MVVVQCLHSKELHSAAVFLRGNLERQRQRSTDAVSTSPGAATSLDSPEGRAQESGRKQDEEEEGIQVT